MSVAYFVVVDAVDPGFDTFVDGKMITKHLELVDALAEQAGLQRLDGFAAQDLSDFGGPDTSDVWFAPEDGVAWATAMLDAVAAGSLPDKAGILDDLRGYLRVFEKAKNSGLRWHLELDF